MTHQQHPPDSPQILMVAAECKGLAKVGGLADVVRDLAAELLDQGLPVRVVIPGYEQIPVAGPTVLTSQVPFAGRAHTFHIEDASQGGFQVDLVRCPEFFAGNYKTVYIDSAARGGGPFEDDAARFAFFSATVAQLLVEESRYQGVQVLHCHDWHTGTLALLTRLSPRFAALRRLPLLFTIHNLDYQGQRPLRAVGANRTASLEGWFPQDFDLLATPEHLALLTDPAAADCYNPMQTAIQLADFVNTVSPNYAQEITTSDDARRSFVGGRGLEKLLAARCSAGTLVGLLNGIDYGEFDPEGLVPPFSATTPDWPAAKATHKERLRQRLAKADVAEASDVAGALLCGNDAETFGKLPLFVAVTRLAGQKVSLLFEEMGSTTPLEALATIRANFVILGTGEYGPRLQAELARTQQNILHVGRFDQALAELIYAAGDLFLMPSDFEPCGISQMIAMRYGTVPVVTPVGGLADTVEDRVNGYRVPLGGTRPQVARALVETVSEAVDDYITHRARFRTLQRQAMSARFTWKESAEGYTRIYQCIRRGLCTSLPQSGTTTSQD